MDAKYTAAYEPPAHKPTVAKPHTELIQETGVELVTKTETSYFE